MRPPHTPHSSPTSPLTSPVDHASFYVLTDSTCPFLLLMTLTSPRRHPFIPPSTPSMNRIPPPPTRPMPSSTRRNTSATSAPVLSQPAVTSQGTPASTQANVTTSVPFLAARPAALARTTSSSSEYSFSRYSTNQTPLHTRSVIIYFSTRTSNFRPRVPVHLPPPDTLTRIPYAAGRSLTPSTATASTSRLDPGETRARPLVPP